VIDQHECECDDVSTWLINIRVSVWEYEVDQL